MMHGDMGQQRLQAAEQRRVVTGTQTTDVPRVEVAQEGQDVDMTVTHAEGSAESIGSQPAGTSSRMEDVLASRKRGTVEMGPPDDRSREIATILMSLGVAGF